MVGLCTTYKLCPLQLWDILIDQDEDTLNMLHTPHVNPRLSAYAHLRDNFGFNRTPLVFHGTKAIIYNVPEKQPTFVAHDIETWYIFPAKDHY